MSSDIEAACRRVEDWYVGLHLGRPAHDDIRTVIAAARKKACLPECSHDAEAIALWKGDMERAWENKLAAEREKRERAEAERDAWKSQVESTEYEWRRKCDAEVAVTRYHKAKCDEALERREVAHFEYLNQKAKVERLEAALRKYGAHLGNCPPLTRCVGIGEYEAGTCTCGLSAALGEKP